MATPSNSKRAIVEVNGGIANPLESTFPAPEKAILSQINRISDDDDEVYLLLLALYAPSPSKCSKKGRVTTLRLIENVMFFSQFIWYPEEIGTFKFKSAAIRLMAGDIDQASLVKILEDYIAKRDAKTELRKKISWWARKPLGFYRWKAIKYFLFEYEQHLWKASKNSREKFHWREFVGEQKGRDFGSIEHILPQQVTQEYWKSRVKDLTVPQRNTLKSSLGNLLPMSQPKNSSLGNRSFPEKRGSATNKVGYAYGCYLENEVAQKVEWSGTQILERGVRLLTFLESRWNVSLGNREEKIKALDLDFVVKRKRTT